MQLHKLANILLPKPRHPLYSITATPLFHFPKKDLRDRQDSDATSDKTFANRYIVYIFMKKQGFGFG
ncbi:MAG: hypothetical protein K9M80_09515 [Candidatus Marinimicrobia bacterium]|nr:hypothetical protein [Candidatus Neomarinimicrobiota bacterium]